MDIITEAFSRLYPDKTIDKEVSLKYSGKFSDYNPNVRMSSYSLEFKLSKKWRGVNKEIVIGLIQDLMTKLYKNRQKTFNIELYHNFVKSLHYAAPTLESDPKLVACFQRVNEEYFNGMIDRPNIVWGNFTRRKLGCYDFHTDTITISRILENAELDLLEYVIYHETLHKKMKFKSTASRSNFHTHEFKKAERAFENAEDVERRLKTLGRRVIGRNKSFFDFFR